jgi:hypothetical protein
MRPRALFRQPPRAAIGAGVVMLRVIETHDAISNGSASPTCGRRRTRRPTVLDRHAARGQYHRRDAGAGDLRGRWARVKLIDEDEDIVILIPPPTPQRRAQPLGRARQER